MAVIQRIVKYFRIKNISQKKISDNSPMSASAVSKVFKGGTKNPGIEFFIAVGKVCPELNWNWVFTGNGGQEIGEDVSGLTPELQKRIEKYMGDRMELLEKLVAEKEETGELKEQLLKAEQLLRQKDGRISVLEKEVEKLRK